jgi:hypothetical protein
MSSKGVEFEILAGEPEPAKFERDGTVRHYFKQWARLSVDGRISDFEFSNDEPLPPGPATLDPKSFGIVNGRLQLGRVKLLPLRRAAVVPSSSKVSG